MLEKIREILSRQLDLDPEDVSENAGFRDDLGVDSLDMLDLVLDLEEAYGFEIPAEDLLEIHTVGDLLDHLKENGISE